SPDAGTMGFATGAFDGKYVYIAPQNAPQNGEPPIAQRYDTSAAFGNSGSWTAFDISSVSAQARDFAGVVFDGRFLYFVPFKDANNAYGGHTVRYDTTKPFAQAGSWEAFD